MSEIVGARTAAAVLVLLKSGADDQGRAFNRNVLLIERSMTVKTHRGQVAFPGGGMELQDAGDPVAAALRECHEEVGLLPDQVKVIRSLPPLPTLTSGFFVHAVLAEWNHREEPELKLDPEEVAHAEWVDVSALLKTRNIENGFPVFQWQGADQKNRKVWGLTAIIFDLLFRSDTESV
jgi:8-oxo-dGTP pyrophosphatase MutT (NUDIX family)